MKLRLLAAAAGLLAADLAEAQTGAATAITTGASVRATVTHGPQRRITGDFVRMTTDTLTLSRAGSATFALPLAQVGKLEVRGDRDPWRGARWGAGLLGGVAVVFGGIDTARGRLGGGEYAGAIIGNVVIGGLLGYAIAPRSWVEVPRHLLGSGASHP